MPPKPLEPLAKKLMKGVIALELLAVVGVYGLFHMMNNSRDFRSTMNRRCPSILEDASQTSGASGQEADEGCDRSGAAGRRRGVRSLSHDEQQPRFQEHHEQEVSIHSRSLLPVQRVGGRVRHPRGRPRSLVVQTRLRVSLSLT
ncbi:uncharacterized protein LOC113137123 isoform X1 [Mastacembelus armatus]|uniref:uncharacterized protein LOC113137123 isoform X1 n=1 Tax=Mastacembelus armatus TaxID=205130 RepID=UPI000E45B9F5|nr:protein CEBPZOS isoform X1 [Mastacembelus armatus]